MVKFSGTANIPIIASAKTTAPTSIQGALLPKRETVLSLKYPIIGSEIISKIKTAVVTAPARPIGIPRKLFIKAKINSCFTITKTTIPISAKPQPAF